MRSRFTKSLLVTLLALSACRTALTIAVVPIGMAMIIVRGVGSLLVSSESVGDEDELLAGGVHVQQHMVDMTLEEDLAVRGTLKVVSTVTSVAGLKRLQQASLSYDPDSQELELVAARVVSRDGAVHEVDLDQVFERPSAVAQGAPGYVNKVTKSVLLPQLTVGSETHLEWRFKESGAHALGFDYSWRPQFGISVDEAQIKITYPESVALRFDAPAPFKFTEGESGSQRVATATLTGYEAQTPERAMVAPRDVCPTFLATTTETWEEIGAAFHQVSIGRVEVTPEIRALALEIAGDRQGLEAAREVHRWVCENIHYVIVYMDQSDGWVPRPAGDVLERGYGDCKDKYVLTASLLSALGIEAEPVLIRQDRGFVPFALPTALQFDHCMLYLPEYDVYSNPTDPFRDLGELEAALSDKFVVIGAEVGRVARTPVGSPDDNTYRAQHVARIASDGIVSGRTVLDMEGRTSGEFRRGLAETGNAEQSGRGILLAGDLGGHGNFHTSDPSDLDTPLHCEGEWESDIPLSMGSTIRFTTPSGVDPVNAQLLREFVSAEDRRYPLLIAAIEFSWHYELELPEGFQLDELPAGRSKETPAGRYQSAYSISADGRRIVIDRLLRIEDDRFPAERYEELRTVLLEAIIDVQTIMSASLGG